MAIFGIGIHIIFAILFAIHAIRTNQNTYWLFILFMFPGLGSIVYFIAIYLPQSRIERGAEKVMQHAKKIMDPTKNLRDAKAAFDYTPTAQNQLNYARALLESGRDNEAAMNFEACLTGLFADDLEIRFQAARAFLNSSNTAKALDHIQFIEGHDAKFRPEAILLLKAKCLKSQGHFDEAKLSFRAAFDKSGSFESLVENGIFAFETNDTQAASQISERIDFELSRMSKHAKSFHAPLLKRWHQLRNDKLNCVEAVS